MTNLLENKRILITGATGGIGRAIVEMASAQGAIIAISGTSEEKLSRLAAEFPCIKSKIVANLNDKLSCESMIKKAVSEMNGLDILVCNAGITKDNLSLRMKIEDFEDVINVNLTSSFILNKLAIEQMIKQRSGRIINISSVIASMGNAGQANYAASKAGIEGMTRSLAKEVAKRNITINSIAPGFIETSMTEVLSDEQKQKIKANIPMGDIGKAKDIADSVLFLASNMANYITGITLHVNGGLYMAA